MGERAGSRTSPLVPSGIDYVQPPVTIHCISTASPSSIFAAECTEDGGALGAFGRPELDASIRAIDGSPQQSGSTLFSRRQTYHEGKLAQSTHQPANGQQQAASGSASIVHRRPLHIDTSPFATSRPVFYRRKSSLSSVHTNPSLIKESSTEQDSSPDQSEVATPTVSPFSNYSFTPKTTSTASASTPGTAVSAGPSRSAFSRDIGAVKAERSRPLLLRSISEDVQQVRRTVAFHLPAADEMNGELEALELQTRALTHDSAYRPGLRLDTQSLRYIKPRDGNSQQSRTRVQSAQATLLSSQTLPLNSSKEELLSSSTSRESEDHLTHTATEESVRSSPISRPSERSQQASTSQHGDPASRRRWPSPRRVAALTESSPLATGTDHGSSSRSLLAGLDAATTEAIRRAAATVRSLSPTGDPAALMMAGLEARRDTAQTSSLGVHSGIMGNCGNGYFGDAIREKVSSLISELLPGSSSILVDPEIKVVEYGSLTSTSACLIKPIMAECTQLRSQASPRPMRPTYTVLHCDGPDSEFRPLMRQIDNPASDAHYQQTNSEVFPSFVARPFGARVCSSASVDVGFSMMDLHTKRNSVNSGRSSESAAGLAAAAVAAHMDMQAFLQARATEFKKDGLLLLAYIQRSEESEAGLSHGPGHVARAASLHDTRYRASGQSSSSLVSAGSGTSLSRSLNPSLYSLSNTTDESLSSPATSTTSLLSSSEPSRSPASSAHISFPLSRCRSGSSPPTPGYNAEAASRQKDIWSAIPTLLAPCIQRLVSTGLIKSDVAHKLLTPPLHPRTPSQTMASLRAAKGQWKLEWSCGLPASSPPSPTARPTFDTTILADNDTSPSTPTPASANVASTSRNFPLPEPSVFKVDATGPISEDALKLVHPAYVAYQSSALPRIQFAEHALQFVRVLYEAHFRTILREEAKLSRGRLEEVLDILNETLREKIEEPGRPALALELECCVVALRRL